MQKSFICVIIVALLASGCAPKLGGSDYDAAAVGEVSETKRGTITAVRIVNINAKDVSSPGAGAVIGGVSGGLLGSTIGRGRGNLISSVAGGLLGGTAGHLAEQGLTNQQGYEYQVRLDNGTLMTISQGAEPKLTVGQHVLVIISNKYKGRSRVVPDTTG